MSFYKHHIFVCENERETGHPKGCCLVRGSRDVFKGLKEALKQTELGASCRVNRAGCLNRCALGPTMVIYPEGIWYGHVTLEDVPEIVQALVDGRVVERLKI